MELGVPAADLTTLTAADVATAYRDLDQGTRRTPGTPRDQGTPKAPIAVPDQS